MPERRSPAGLGLRAARLGIVLVALSAIASGCAGLGGRRALPPGYPIGYVERGDASWYGPGFHGKRTANGETFNMQELTAAHRTLPFGAIVRVTSRVTGRHVTVRINDRGPFVRGRIVDLSHAAARAIGMIGAGTHPVDLRVVAYRGGDRVLAPLRVQVASFAEETRARELARRLKQRYDEVHIAVVDLSIGRRYRVHVGRFQSEREAAAEVARIEEVFQLNGLVVRTES